MKPLIVGNWKMNPQTYKEAEDLVKGILKHTKGASGVEIVLCPPFTWLTDFSHKNESSILFGAQNVFYKEKGAYTGEISPQMLKSSKVDYVIIGHSERRIHFGETAEIINKKLRAVLEYKLTPILCVGEKENEDKNEVLTRQLANALAGISNFKFQISNLVVAYEPVWAIGTGKNCSVNETISSVLLIRKIIANLYNRQVADGVAILYGGSVNAQNSTKYLSEGGVDGLLVGGASLDAQEFLKIIKSAG